MPLSLPKREFPAYSYVPGMFPHPLRDPAGHSYGVATEPCEPLTTDNARQHQKYLWGIQLFNHGYYWEAHETWEQAWHACGRKGLVANYLKGLIKLAAAGVKTREGRPEGVARHASRGAELFREAIASLPAAESAPFGLSLASLLSTAEHVAAHREDFMNTSQALVAKTLPTLPEGS